MRLYTSEYVYPVKDLERVSKELFDKAKADAPVPGSSARFEIIYSGDRMLENINQPTYLVLIHVT